MKVTTVASPHQVAPTPTSNQTDSRSRAMSAFLGGQDASKQAPVPQHATQHTEAVANPNQVSVEEMGAIIPTPNIEASQVAETTDNSASIEDTVKAETQDKQEPKEDSLSKQYQQLVRRERQLREQARKQAQEFKAKEDAFKLREAELASKSTVDESKYINKDFLKSKTLQALTEAGVSYDDIVQQALNQQPLDPRVEAYISKLESKVSQLENNWKEAETKATTQQQEQYQAAVKQIRTDVRSLVNTDPTYETVKATNSVQDVVELIEKTYNEDGILLSVEEASQKVEDYLVEEATKLAKLSKVQKRLQPPQASAKPQPPKKTDEPKQPQTMKTLTNQVSGSRQLSARERAILAFKGENRS